MANASLIVCEKSGRWALALRSTVRESVRVVETRALSQAEQALRSAPASLVALDVAAVKLPQVVDFAIRARRDYPAARLLALLDASLESAAPLLREAGVSDIFYSPLQAAAIARLALQHVLVSPAEDRPLRESIAARLPWETWATPGFAASISPPQD